jgi:hypothetical protein
VAGNVRVKTTRWIERVVVLLGCEPTVRVVTWHVWRMFVCCEQTGPLVNKLIITLKKKGELTKDDERASEGGDWRSGVCGATDTHSFTMNKWVSPQIKL